MPIGNVNDLTFRAKELLTNIKCIFCEDRRQTQELFKRAGIKTQARLICLNEHQEIHSQSYLENIQNQGQDAAFVTDAGTPSISDPGSMIVSHAHKMNIKVSPLPGPSALSTFLSVIGAPSMPVHFVGFLPKKKQAKIDFFSKEIDSDRLLVFFESPHRVRDTLLVLRDLNISFPIYMAREMTKTFEEIKVINKEDLDDPSWLTEKGEFVLGIVQNRTQSENWMEAAIELQDKLGLKSTSLFVQKYFNVPKNTVYKYLLNK